MAYRIGRPSAGDEFVVVALEEATLEVDKGAVHVLLSRFYPDFIQISSRFYLDFIQIFSRFEKKNIQILSRFYPSF